MADLNHPFFAQPVLRGHGLRLEPLGPQHEAGLKAAAADGELWKLWVTSVPEPEQTAKYIADARRMHAEGKRVPYAVLDDASGKVLGSTSFHDLIPETKRLEIGYTWYAKSVQKSHVNTACKLLMMQRAFDELGCAVVGWRTDIFNRASQQAIEKLGAEREGILLSHALRRNGSVRDTVIYSMPAQQWVHAKPQLLARLTKLQGAAPRSDEAPPPSLQWVRLADLAAAQVRALGRLSPGALGSLLVSPNAVSVTDAWGHPNAVLWGLVRTEPGQAQQLGEPVGLLLLYDASADPTHAAAEGHAPDALYIWRLSIGFDHQSKGYGRAAVEHALTFARGRAGVSHVLLSHRDLTGHAGPFYERLGFRYTGKVDEDGERYMRLDLT